MNRRILHLAIPSIVSNITVPLLGLVDVTIVGHLGATAYIGAIAVGGLLFNILYWNFGFLRMGTSGLTSQAYGRKDKEAEIRVLVQAVSVGLFSALAMLILQYPIERLAFRLLDTSAEVEQYALHREAYDYYFNLQKNIEESGSLFAPIPSEMKGNIRCVTDPEVPVIGFVEVATVTRLKRFFPEIGKVYEAEVTGCASTIVQGSEYDNNPDYGYVSYNPMNAASNTYALKRCMDCGRFGSKQKPSWWPTSHL